MSIGLGALAVGLLAVAMLMEVPSVSMEVGRPVAVSTVDGSAPLVRSHEAPSIVVDRNRSSTLYASGVELRSGACQFWVSTDGAETWDPETVPSLEPFTRNCGFGSAQPHNVRTHLAQGPDGTLYLAFQANSPQANGTRSVLLASSGDGGRSWRTTLVYEGPTASSSVDPEINFQAHVAVDPERPQRVYVTWRRSYAASPEPTHVGRRTRSYLAVSDDGGRTFGPARLLFDRETGADGPRLIVVDGWLYAFYVDVTTPLATPDPSPSPAGGRVSVAISGDGGQSWERIRIAEAPAASDPIPVHDRRRGLFSVVWHDGRTGDLDVYLSQSTDGSEWTPPRRLNDDPPGTRVGQHYPQIAISPNGRLDVAWYDWRDDPFPPPGGPDDGSLDLFTNRGHQASVYLTSSDDGGRTWVANRRVSDTLIDRTIGTWAPNFDVITPPAIASLARQAVVVWSDTRHGTVSTQTQDLYSATVTFSRSAGTGSVTETQAGVTGLLLGAGGAMWTTSRLHRRRARRGGRLGGGAARPARDDRVLVDA